MKKLLCLFALAGLVYGWALLANPSRGDYFATLQPDATQTIWISSNGWHTGIIVPIDKIPRHLLPEKADFPYATYLEMGWGDAGFYQAEDITTSLAVRALLTPTPSVVHLAGFRDTPETMFPHSTVMALPVSDAGMLRLLEGMHAGIARDGRPRAPVLRQGLYSHSAFYPGVGEYSLLHTCNHWAADRLAEAGIPLTPWYAATTGALLWQAERYRKPA